MIETQLMKAKLKFIYLLVGLAAIFSSCRTSAPRLDYQALARASILLGVDVNLEDNHKLYLEAADWIGVPYRGGVILNEEQIVRGWFIKCIERYTAPKCHAIQKT